MGRTTLLENGQEPSITSRRLEEDSPLEEELSLDQPPAQINNLSLEDSANSTALKRKRNKPAEVNRAGTRSEAVVLAKSMCLHTPRSYYDPEDSTDFFFLGLCAIQPSST